MAAVIPASIKPQAGMTDADYRELVEFAFQQGNLARSARDIILQIVNLDRIISVTGNSQGYRLVLNGTETIVPVSRNLNEEISTRLSM